MDNKHENQHFDWLTLGLNLLISSQMAEFIELPAGWYRPWHLSWADPSSSQKDMKPTPWLIVSTPRSQTAIKANLALCQAVFVASPKPVSREAITWWWAGWANKDRGGGAYLGCHGWCVNKKAPHFNAFKWPLWGLYLILCSENWWEYSFK